MPKTHKWGILSTGSIAASFAEALNYLDNAELLAVASRTLPKAEAFADRFNVARRYASYEELAADPDVEIVYIGTPHIFHAENIRMCLEHGKHVLCEKPFTINAQEADECIQLARQKGLFLMEAMWMRFIPAMKQVRDWMAESKIGALSLVQADFSVNLPYDPQGRIYNRMLGGGALLDVGIYPLSLTSMLLGLPESVQSHAQIGVTGVDEQAAMLFSYENGAAALLSCGVRAAGPCDAFIKGTEGYIRIHQPFHHPQNLSLHLPGEAEPQPFEIPYESTGLNYEAAEVQRCLDAGKLESDVMPLDETLSIMRLMDAMRSDWGLAYPGEM